jgi:hypothetical protein
MVFHREPIAKASAAADLGRKDPRKVFDKKLLD